MLLGESEMGVYCTWYNVHGDGTCMDCGRGLLNYSRAAYDTVYYVMIHVYVDIVNLFFVV